MQRLDLNLATRPFRNNTLIWAGYGVALAMLLGFAIWNGTTYYVHAGRLEEQKSRLEELAAQQADLDRRERVAERQRKERDLALEALTVQSLKANEVIEWKAFSWTALFNRIEVTLPWNVYMSAVRPIFRSERGIDTGKSTTVRSRPVAVEGYAKSLAAMLEFERNLFASEYFDNPEPIRHAPDERGELVFTMRFTYYPDGRKRPTVLDEPEVTTADASDAAGEGDAAAAEPAAETAQADTPTDAAGKDSIGGENPPTIQRRRKGDDPPASKNATQEMRP